jgi:hypothetical protein
MLIVNDTQRLLAGVVSLNEPCPYCSQPLGSYPLILSNGAAQTVYHAACAVELATTSWSISSPSSVHRPHMSDCLYSPPPMMLLPSSPL